MAKSGFKVMLWLLVVLLSLASAGAEKEPVCGNHSDIWGFVVQLPDGVCGQRYLHGMNVDLESENADEEEHRRIVVYAAGNPNFYESSAEVVDSYATTARTSSKSFQVVARRGVEVGGMRGDLLHYRYRDRAGNAWEDVVVSVLRPVHPDRGVLGLYEYSFILRSRPATFVEDKQVLDSLLTTATFTDPDV